MKPRQVLLLCASGDLLGVLLAGSVVDRGLGSDLYAHPQWLALFGLGYVFFSWLFGSYTLLRWPRLALARVLVRLGAAALATTLAVVLAYWLFKLPVTFTLGHRRIQLALLIMVSLWALGLRILLRSQVRQRQRPVASPLEMAEHQQQRLLPAHLPEEALTLADVPWADSLSVQRQLKRFADIAVAAALLLLTLPLMALAALLIWLDDRGPVFYVQERSGWMGETFRLYKLRTMRQADPAEPARWTTRRDDRITRVGWLLRRVRLDELPQLLNVLRGDMSLIGPRPERPEIDAALERQIPNYRLRYLARPGLSGWAQVCFPYGASVEDSRMKLSYDIYYIRNANLLLDLFILIKTIRLVLRGAGSEPTGNP